MKEMAGPDASQFVFLDETGTNTAMARRYGRAPRGQRVDGPVPHGHWQTVTLTAAIRLGGVGGCLAFESATDASSFGSHVEMALVPTLRRGDIVVMDNLSAHKGAVVGRLIRTAGAESRYLPAYSPDFNPIEEMFSKLKTYLRKAAACSMDRLTEAMGEELRLITHEDIAGWFRSYGCSSRKRKPL